MLDEDMAAGLDSFNNNNNANIPLDIYNIHLELSLGATTITAHTPDKMKTNFCSSSDLVLPICRARALSYTPLSLPVCAHP